MKKLTLAVFLVVSFFVVSAAAKDMTGWISDSKCAAKGAKAEHADCAKKCVEGGASPVFVSDADGKVYKVDDASKVQDHIGHKVTVSGSVKSDTVQVKSVKMAS